MLDNKIPKSMKLDIDGKQIIGCETQETSSEIVMNCDLADKGKLTVKYTK